MRLVQSSRTATRARHPPRQPYWNRSFRASGERRVERFFYLFVIAILFDAILYKFLDSGWAFTVLTVMILILLVHLEACLSWISGRKPGSETE